VRERPDLDLVFYDSDKSYRGMRDTWELAWSYLQPGGVLVADDIDSNDAFLDFAEQLDLVPLIVPKPRRQGVYRWSKIYYVGLLRKPR
jgi:predicted O-methyltransferase YrrM